MSLSRLHLFLLFLLTSVFSGCIKEDLSDCPVGLRVYFTYQYESVNPAEVDRIDLYVFDETGIFRGVWTDSSPELSPTYYMTLPELSHGNYRFITWGGMYDCYSATPTSFIVGQTTFTQALLVLDHLSGQAPDKLHPLIHAEKTESVTSIREQKIIMSLTQLTNRINLRTEGLSDNGNTHRFTITDSNGKYTFDHSFALDSDFDYTAPCHKDAQGQLLSSLTVLRLAADRHPQLTVLNETNGHTLYTEDLCRLINAMENVDYENTHTFDIHLNFTGASVDVSVNGWQVVEDGEIILHVEENKI